MFSSVTKFRDQNKITNMSKKFLKSEKGKTLETHKYIAFDTDVGLCRGSRLGNSGPVEGHCPAEFSSNHNQTHLPVAF